MGIFINETGLLTYSTSCITILELKDFSLHVVSEYFARPFLPLGVVKNTAICN